MEAGVPLSRDHRAGSCTGGRCRARHVPVSDDFSTSKAGVVPLDQRRPMWHFTGLWTTFVAGFSFMVPGFVMYADRFSLAAAAGASLLGYGIYVAYALVGAHPGAQTGQTLTLLTRAVFGRAGSWLVFGFYGWGTWRSSRSWWPR
jgi:purine-cytosine permease-like protein